MLKRPFPFTIKEPLKLPSKLPVNPDLRLYYPLSEGVGNSLVHDFSMYGLHGTMVNSPSWASGKPAGQYGPALQFNGINQYVNRVDFTGSPLDIITEITLQAWIYMTVAPAGVKVIINKHSSYGLLTDNVSRTYFNIMDAAVWRSSGVSANLSLNEWHLIQGIFDGLTVYIYADLTLGNSAPYIGDIDVSNNPLTIGAFNAASNQFQGIIAEPKIFAKALDAQERRWEYESRMKGKR